MVVSWSVSIVLAFTAPLVPVRAGQEGDRNAASKGRRILAAALEKRGGLKALAAIKDYELRLSGTGRSRGGAAVRIETVRKVLLGRTPCLLDRSTIHSPGEEWLQKMTVKGGRGYQQTRLGGGPMSGERVARTWAGFHRSTVGILRVLLDASIKVDYAGRRKVGEQEVEVIRVRRPHEPPLDVDVHPESGFFLRVRWRERPRSGGPPVPHEIRYRSFKPFGGLKGVPLQAEVRVDGRLVMTRRTRAVRVNLGLKASDFEVE